MDEFPERKFPASKQYGWLASEVAEVTPELVYTDPEGYLGVAYAHATVLVAEAVKDLHKKHEQEFSDMRQMYDKALNEMREAFNKELGSLKSDLDLLRGSLDRCPCKI